MTRRPDVDAETVAVGDQVTSKWSGSGATWTVESVGELDRPYVRHPPRRYLDLFNPTTNRRRRASTWDLVQVLTD